MGGGGREGGERWAGFCRPVTPHTSREFPAGCSHPALQGVLLSFPVSLLARGCRAAGRAGLTSQPAAGPPELSDNKSDCLFKKRKEAVFPSLPRQSPWKPESSPGSLSRANTSRAREPPVSAFMPRDFSRVWALSIPHRIPFVILSGFALHILMLSAPPPPFFFKKKYLVDFVKLYECFNAKCLTLHISKASLKSNTLFGKDDSPPELDCSHFTLDDASPRQYSETRIIRCCFPPWLF